MAIRLPNPSKRHDFSNSLSTLTVIESECFRNASEFIYHLTETQGGDKILRKLSDLFLEAEPHYVALAGLEFTM